MNVQEELVQGSTCSSLNVKENVLTEYVNAQEELVQGSICSSLNVEKNLVIESVTKHVFTERQSVR